MNAAYHIILDYFLVVNLPWRFPSCHFKHRTTYTPVETKSSNVKRGKKAKSTRTKINIQNSYSGVMIKFSYFSWITLNYLGKIKDESLRGQLKLEAECILVQVNTGIKIFNVLSFVYFLLLFSFFQS